MTSPPTPRALALEEDAKKLLVDATSMELIASHMRGGGLLGYEMVCNRAAATLRELARMRETIAKAEAWLKDNPFSNIEADGDAIDCRTHVLVATGPTLLAALAALPEGKT